MPWAKLGCDAADFGFTWLDGVCEVKQKRLEPWPSEAAAFVTHSIWGYGWIWDMSNKLPVTSSTEAST